MVNEKKRIWMLRRSLSITSPRVSFLAFFAFVDAWWKGKTAAVNLHIVNRLTMSDAQDNTGCIRATSSNRRETVARYPSAILIVTKKRLSSSIHQSSIRFDLWSTASQLRSWWRLMVRDGWRVALWSNSNGNRDIHTTFYFTFTTRLPLRFDHQRKGHRFFFHSLTSHKSQYKMASVNNSCFYLLLAICTGICIGRGVERDKES